MSKVDNIAWSKIEDLATTTGFIVGQLVYTIKTLKNCLGHLEL